MKIKLLALIFSMCFSTASQAIIITKSFPSLEGKYDYLDDRKSISFDLEKKFSSISYISVKLTASAKLGAATSCVGLAFNISCTQFSKFPSAFYMLNNEVSDLTASGIIDIVAEPDISTYGKFLNSESLSGTDFFLDGKGTLSIEHMLIDLLAGIEGWDRYPSFEVFDITLTIEGVVAPTAVPLPFSLPLFMSGLSGLLFLSKRRYA